jgi:uncharacterized membrane protein
MKRMLGFVLALAVMAGMSMPTFAQEKGKDEGKKGTSAVEKKAGQEGDAKKADTAKKEEPKKDVKKAAKKGAKKGDKKEDKKDEKKST